MNRLHPHRRTLLIAATAAAIAPRALAAERPADVRILSGGAVQPGLDKVVAAFAARTAFRASVEYTPSAGLRRRIETNDLADILIAPDAVMSAAVDAGRAQRAAVIGVGRVGVGVIVPAGGSPPDVSSVQALTAAIRGARTVVYNREGSTGIYLAQLVERLGLAQDIAGRTERPSDGAAVIHRINDGQAGDIGFAALTEIQLEIDEGRAGKVRLVAPLPDGAQNYTTYQAAALSAAPSPAAAAFIAHLRGEGAAIMRAAGIV